MGRDAIWSRWVRAQRKARQMTRRALAELAGMDPSYITLIERDGYVPSRSKVSAIGGVFGDTSKALIYAGYISDDDRKFIINALDNAKMLRLEPEVQRFIGFFSKLKPRAQHKALGVLAAHLEQ